MNLNYKDILVYVAIRSFLNTESGTCWPSYVTIGETAGVSREFVRKSIKRLNEARLITVHRPSQIKKPNRYTFPRIEAFNRVPYDVLGHPGLTSNETAILLCLYTIFMREGRTTRVQLTKRSNELGLTYNTLYKQYCALVQKGFIEEQSYRKIKRYRMTLTYKIPWLFPDWQRELEEKPALMKFVF